MKYKIEIENVPSSSRRNFIIKENKQVVSYLSCYPEKDPTTWHIFELYTKKAYRRKKYASEILKYAIQYFKNCVTIHTITLSAVPDSEISSEQPMEFYKKLGFVHIPGTINQMRLYV